MGSILRSFIWASQSTSQQWALQSSLTPVPCYGLWGGCGGKGQTQRLTLFPAFLFSLPVSLPPERSLMDQKLLPYILILRQVESWDGILVSSLPTTQVYREWLMLVLKQVMEQAGCSQTCSWPLGSIYPFQVRFQSLLCLLYALTCWLKSSQPCPWTPQWTWTSGAKTFQPGCEFRAVLREQPARVLIFCWS